MVAFKYLNQKCILVDKKVQNILYIIIKYYVTRVSEYLRKFSKEWDTCHENKHWKIEIYSHTVIAIVNKLPN